MGMIYRGYPQALAAQIAPWSADIVRQEMPGTAQMAAQNVRNAEVEPYMLYNREEQPQWTDGWDNRQWIQAEYDYFRGLYPLAVKQCQRLVEEECDRIDGPGCFMYDEYPDRETLYRMCRRILEAAEAAGYPMEREMTQVLLLNEIMKRRNLRR